MSITVFLEHLKFYMQNVSNWTQKKKAGFKYNLEKIKLINKTVCVH
jgi:hypothetical protein